MGKDKDLKKLQKQQQKELKEQQQQQRYGLSPFQTALIGGVAGGLTGALAGVGSNYAYQSYQQHHYPQQFGQMGMMGPQTQYPAVNNQTNTVFPTYDGTQIQFP